LEGAHPAFTHIDGVCWATIARQGWSLGTATNFLDPPIAIIVEAVATEFNSIRLNTATWTPNSLVNIPIAIVIETVARLGFLNTGGGRTAFIDGAITVAI
jgi:hypothetical protein